MSTVKPFTFDEAPDDVRAIYAADIADLGYVADHTALMSMNTEAMAAWRQLVRAITAHMPVRVYELVTLAAALGIGSAHCRLAHGRKSLRLFSDAELVRIANDYRAPSLVPEVLSAAEVAAMAFAEKVSRDATSMTDADSATLRAHGYSDRAIVDIALAAAARNYYSRAVLALAAQVEELPDISEELRDALLAGLPSRAHGD